MAQVETHLPPHLSWWISNISSRAPYAMLAIAAACASLGAKAANECGAAATVSCDNSGVPGSNSNPYANGISYTGPNVNLTLTSGAAVNTTGGTLATSATVGVGVATPLAGTSAGNASLTVESGASVTVTQNSARALAVNGTGAGSTATIVNNGSVSMLGTGGYGIAATNNGDISITNGATGVVSGAALAGLYANDPAGNHRVTITNDGQVTTTGVLAGIYVVPRGANSTVTVIQNGTVSGSSAGVLVQYASSVGVPSTVTNSGSITGTSTGLYFTGAGTVTASNTGSITSLSGIGVRSATTVAGTSITNSGAGSIIGTTGVSLEGASGSLINSGTITGTGGTAISISASNSALTLGTGSVLNGDVSSTGTGNTLQFIGSGMAASNFAGFSTLTMSGTLWQLSGNVSPVAGTSIAAGGTLQIGAGGASGSLTGDVADNGTLAFHRADTVTFGGMVSGSGAVQQMGPGATILTANNSYTGGTVISGGTLQLGNGGATGSIVGDVANHGTLAFNRSDAVTFGGAISGAGMLNQTGPGTTILTANNSYTGGTVISGGTLQLGNGGATGSIVGDVANNAILAFDRSTDMVLAGAISGPGVVIQQGTGAVTLSGTNTYTGGTTISAGTLIGSATSFGSGAIQNDAALVLDQGGDANFANAINGSGSLTKRGAGGVNLTATSAFSGPTTVAVGLLSVNGSIANSAVTVMSGAALGGNGTVGATTIQPGGTVAPGNSIGTLNVNGNFTQAAGSIYQAQVDPNSNASDRVSVSGSATLQSGAVLQVSKITPGSYSLDTRYTVLTAAGGLTGTYSLAGDASGAFYSLLDSYDGNNVYLTWAQTRSFTSAALTPNQFAVSGALQSLPAGNRLKDAVGLLSTDVEARGAFNQLSGDGLASTTTQLVEASRFVRDAATDRLRQSLCSVGGARTDIGAKAVDSTAAFTTTLPLSNCNPDRPEAWVRVFGSWGSTDGDADAAKLSSSIRGLFAGTDMRVFDTWRAGVMAGYSRSSFDVKDRNFSGTSDNYDLGLYGGTQWGNLGLRLGTTYTWHSIDSQRSVLFPGYADRLSASYDAGTTQAFGELGWRIDAGTVQLEPFANLAYVRQSTDGFSEQGSLAALTRSSDSFGTTFSTIGARATTAFAAGGIEWTAHGTLAWRHAYGDTVPTSQMAFAGSTPFTVSGVPIARDAAVVELGVTAPVAKNAVVDVSYAGQMGNGMRDNGVRASLNWKF